MFKLRQFPVSDSTKATRIPILLEDTLCKPGLRRTCQRVTHYRGKKEKVAQAVAGLDQLGIVRMTTMLSERHSCRFAVYCEQAKWK
jgi:hypothetical protein